MKNYICPCGISEKKNKKQKKSGNHGKMTLSWFQLHMLTRHLDYTMPEALGLKTNLAFRKPESEFHLKVNRHILSKLK